jgi:hypothetical protein
MVLLYNRIVMQELLDKIPWEIAILLVLSIGLVPYKPPHIWEKLLMLSQGTLKRPMDWFDLLLHGTPWLILVLKAFFSFRGGQT